MDHRLAGGSVACLVLRLALATPASAFQSAMPLSLGGWQPSSCLPTSTHGGLYFGPSGDSRHAEFVATRPEILPDARDWTIGLDFTASLSGTYGTGFALRDAANSKDYLRVHVDQGLGSIQLYAGDDARSMVVAGSAWDGSPMQLPREAIPLLHHYRLEKRGEQITMFLDGKRLIALDGGGRRWCLRLGSDATVPPGLWSTFTVSQMEVLDDRGQAVVRYSGEGSSRETVGSVDLDGAITGVEAVGIAPAVIGETGHLRIVAKEGLVRVSPGTVVEFRPRADVPNFVASEVGLVVDGALVTTKRLTLSDKLLPVLSFAASDTIGAKSRVQIVAADERRRQVVVARLDVEVVAKPPSVAYVREGEIMGLTQAEGLGTVWPYAQEKALGKCVNPGKLRIDVRKLPVGTLPARADSPGLRRLDLGAGVRIA